VQISHGGSQGFKSPHLHPNIAGQSVASVERAALTAWCGRTTAAPSGRNGIREDAEVPAARPRLHAMITKRGRRIQSTPSSASRATPYNPP
jgi:hypothetical protein